MKKRALAAAVLAAVTLSAASAFAAPIIWSGEVEYEYEVEKKGDESEKSHEVSMELNLKSKVDSKSTIYATVELKNELNNEDKEEENKIELENVYLKYKLSEQVGLKLGAQPLEIGKGVWLDIDGFTGVNIEFEQGETELNVYHGEDSQDLDDTGLGEVQKITVFDLKHQFSGSEGGIYTGKQADKKFFGIYGETKINPQSVLSAEWMKNSTDNRHGYAIEAEFGKAKKVGEFEYAVSYRDMEADLFNSNDFTGWDDNFKESKGFKGMGMSVGYKLSEKTVLKLSHEWGEQKTDKIDRATTELSMKMKF